jgi:hypothetical protein
MSAPAGHDNEHVGDLPTSVVVAVTLLLMAVVAAVTVLTLMGKPVSNLLVLVGTIVVPTVTALLAVRNSRKVANLTSKVDGKIDNLITDKSNLETQVTAAGLIPITSKVSWDPDSSGRFARVVTDTAPQQAAPRHAERPSPTPRNR